MGLSDGYIQKKYVEFAQREGIPLASNVFKRMNLDVKVNERLEEMKDVEEIDAKAAVDKKDSVTRKLTEN